MTQLVNSSQKNFRPFGLGGSDISAVLGLSPFKTALELWFELVGRTTNEDRDLLHLRFGQHAESFIAKEYERRTGLHTHLHPQTIFHPQHDFMYGHVDRFVTDGIDRYFSWKPGIQSTRLLECKTASVFNRYEWGEDGSSEMPAAYLLQCAWYMAVTNCDEADLAALIGNNDFRIYHLKRDKELEQLVLEHAHKFWHEHVLAKSPPPASSATDAQLLFPKESKDSNLEVTPEMLQTLKEYTEKSAQIKSMTSECDRLKAEILCYMGEAEKLTRSGKTIATWKCTKPSQRIDTKAFAQAHPDIAANFTSSVLGARRFLVKEMS